MAQKRHSICSLNEASHTAGSTQPMLEFVRDVQPICFTTKLFPYRTSRRGRPMSSPSWLIIWAMTRISPPIFPPWKIPEESSTLRFMVERKRTLPGEWREIWVVSSTRAILVVHLMRAGYMLRGRDIMWSSAPASQWKSRSPFSYINLLGVSFYSTSFNLSMPLGYDIHSVWYSRTLLRMIHPPPIFPLWDLREWVAVWKIRYVHRGFIHRWVFEGPSLVLKTRIYLISSQPYRSIAELSSTWRPSEL